MAFDQTAHQGEPNTEARVRAPRRRIRLDEVIKYVRQNIGGNADASVANANGCFAVFPLYGQPHIASRKFSRKFNVLELNER